MAVNIDGYTLAEHRAIHPARWRSKHRAWPQFWWSFGLIPATLVLSWVSGAGFGINQEQGWLIAGYILRSFFLATDPPERQTTWMLDSPSLTQRIKRAFKP